MKKCIIVLAFLWAILFGCSRNQNAEHNHEHGTECNHDHEHNDSHNHDHEDGDDHDHGKDDHPDTDEIIFTPEQAKAVGLEVIEVAPVVFHQVIKTSGQILSAQGDEATISATTSGIVAYRKVALNEGTPVKNGELLLSISSKNIVDGDPTEKARTAYNIAQKEFQRAESLIADKLISEKEYNDIRLNYENAKIAYQALGSRTTANGVSISSPMTGFVKTKLVNEGEYVEVGQPLMTVTQNKRLQLKADVSERYYKDLSAISSANFKTSYDVTAYSLSNLNGRLVSYGKSASSQEYYLPVIFEFDNVGQVVAGSYVEVFLQGKSRNDVLAIPVTALVEEQDTYSVYVQLDEEGYRKQYVVPGASDGRYVEILSGLKFGDKLVSKGAYYVKLASASASIPHAHEH